MTDDPLNAFLNAAFRKDSTKAADAILAEHPEIASTSIHVAAALGDDETVRRLIARDSSLATRKGGPNGHDPLTCLCFSTYLAHDRARTDGFVRAATALLDAGADPNGGYFDPNHRPSPMLESVLYGAAGVAHHPELTQLLLDRGADPNDGEVTYHSPETLDNRAMKVLVESGKLTQESLVLMLVRKFDWHDDEGVAWLLSHGADPNYIGWWKHPPMLHALDRGNPLSYFELMLDHGADPTRSAPNGPSIFAAAARTARADVLELFERRGFSYQLEGDDALLAACARGDEATARRIVASDPGIVERVQANNDGLLAKFAGGRSVQPVRVLLDLGFDIARPRTAPPWDKGWTALHVAAGFGRLDTSKLLIARGAPLGAVNVNGRTPLDVALVSLVTQSEWTPNDATVPIARALLEAGAPFDPKAMTLAAAIAVDRADDAARLLRTATQEEKQMALSTAAYNAKLDGLRTLISQGADVNAYNTGLEPHATPLHSAATSGSLAAVKMLVEAGARPETKDTWFQATPLDWASYYAREAATKGGEPREYAAIVEYLSSRS